MAPNMNFGETATRRRRSRYRPMSEINVTPFVDVMLVLLIIFMVTAPLLTVGVPVDLPKTQAKQLNAQKEPLVVSVNRDGKIFIQEHGVEADELAPKLVAITNNGFDRRIFVRGDKTVNFGAIMKVMGAINVAGFRHIALVSEQETSP